VLNFSVGAAELGFPAAQYSAGIAYGSGRGVEQDYVQAHKWVNLAAAGSFAEASKSRDIFDKLMTLDQIAEAQKLARQWSAKQGDGQ
jgi:hypothetical protein